VPPCHSVCPKGIFSLEGSNGDVTIFEYSILSFFALRNLLSLCVFVYDLYVDSDWVETVYGGLELCVELNAANELYDRVNHCFGVPCSYAHTVTDRLAPCCFLLFFIVILQIYIAKDY
jgi:hypothetical protein